jgi:hypothetical protein
MTETSIRESKHQSITYVTHLSTNTTRRCDHCDYHISSDDSSGAINHYISQHGYLILNIGTETIDGEDNKPWHTTAAVLGTKNPPAPKAESEDFLTFLANDESRKQT